MSTLELTRPGPSYTVDTLTAMSERNPGDELHLLMGADNLLDLPNWRDPERILALARLAVAERPGFPIRRVATPVRRAVTWLPITPVEIASRDLRARVAAGRSIRFLTPAPVERLIASLGLYRGRARGSST